MICEANVVYFVCHEFIIVVLNQQIYVHFIEIKENILEFDCIRKGKFIEKLAGCAAFKLRKRKSNIISKVKRPNKLSEYINRRCKQYEIGMENNFDNIMNILVKIPMYINYNNVLTPSNGCVMMHILWDICIAKINL